MCRKKKIKCDGRMPKCSHCINYKTECVFTQVEKKRNPPKGLVLPNNVRHVSCVQLLMLLYPGQSTSRVSKIAWEGWKLC
jgi:hypothetical protein